MIIWHLFWQLNIRFIFGYYKSRLFCSYKFHRCLYWIRKYVLPYHNLLLPLFGVSKSFHLKFSSPENLVFNEIIFCNKYFLSTSADRSSSSSPEFPKNDPRASFAEISRSAIVSKAFEILFFRASFFPTEMK